MSNPYFQFKQFTVFHDQCAMKVGVDGVTLGAWTNVSDAHSILDIGCGSGLISLMLAQRSSAVISAIDIDKPSIAQAKENVKNSPWENRISVIHTSFQEFAEEYTRDFYLIVSNPPFFINSLKNPLPARTTARHNDTLSHKDLIVGAKKLLNDKGRLSIILPISEGNCFINEAEKETLYCSEKIAVFPNPEKPEKRWLLEFRKEKTTCKESELTIEKKRGVYTEKYREMVKDFYLKL